jgi:hypothetical protein
MAQAVTCLPCQGVSPDFKRTTKNKRRHNFYCLMKNQPKSGWKLYFKIIT